MPRPPQPESKIPRLVVIGKQSDQEVIKEFKKICCRENVTITDRLLSFVRPYVEDHREGNPQQRLDTVLDLGKPYRADQCNMCSLKPVYRCFLGKKSVLLCEDHFERKRAWFTGWKKL